MARRTSQPTNPVTTAPASSAATPTRPASQSAIRRRWGVAPSSRTSAAVGRRWEAPMRMALTIAMPRRARPGRAAPTARGCWPRGSARPRRRSRRPRSGPARVPASRRPHVVPRGSTKTSRARRRVARSATRSRHEHSPYRSGASGTTATMLGRTSGHRRSGPGRSPMPTPGRTQVSVTAMASPPRSRGRRGRRASRAPGRGGVEVDDFDGSVGPVHPHVGGPAGVDDATAGSPSEALDDRRVAAGLDDQRRVQAGPVLRGGPVGGEAQRQDHRPGDRRDRHDRRGERGGRPGRGAEVVAGEAGGDVRLGERAGQQARQSGEQQPAEAHQADHDHLGQQDGGDQREQRLHLAATGRRRDDARARHRVPTSDLHEAGPAPLERRLPQGGRRRNPRRALEARQPPISATTAPVGAAIAQASHRARRLQVEVGDAASARSSTANAGARAVPSSAPDDRREQGDDGGLAEHHPADLPRAWRRSAAAARARGAGSRPRTRRCSPTTKIAMNSATAGHDAEHRRQVVELWPLLAR